jgi:hypothetical protein
MEVSVTIVIVAILALIAVPTYESLAEKTDDNVARQTLHSIDLEFSRIEAGSPGTFPSRPEVVMLTAKSTLVGGDVASTGPGVVSVAADNQTGKAFAAVLSDSGACLVMAHTYDDAPLWAKDPNPAALECRAGHPAISSLTVTGAESDPSPLSLGPSSSDV